MEEARKKLPIVYLTVFIDLLGFGIILPSLPYVAERYGANGLWVGAVMSAYSIAQFISSPLLGRLSDRIGRRPVLLLSLAGSAISFVLSGLAGSLGFLLFARALAGGFGGSIAAAQAVVADVTRPEERSKYMGMLGASIGVGFVVGPAIGAFFADYGFAVASYIAAGLAAVNFVAAVARLPETRPAVGAVARPRLSVRAFSSALKHPSMGVILFAMLFFTFGFVSMESTFALLAQAHFGFGPEKLGYFFTYIGVIMVVVQGGLIGPITRRFGDRNVGLAGTGLALVGFLSLPDVGSHGAFVSAALLAAGQAFVGPTLSALLSKHAYADEQGGVLGMGQSMQAIARAFGPIAAGALFDVNVHLPYWMAGALALASAAMLWQVKPMTDDTVPNAA
jgi:DHA1 family tetracycline resistance protein-like MFS transporter